MSTGGHTVSQDKKTGMWYCHMRGFPYIPCFGSFYEKKSDAMEYAKMYNGLPHKVEKIEQKKEMKMKKIYKDSILFRKNLYKEHFKHCDCFGSSKDAERWFEYDIEVNKCYALNGVWYEIKMPNCTMHDRKLERLTVQAIEYAADEFPQFFRLIDELKRRGIYRSL